MKHVVRLLIISLLLALTDTLSLVAQPVLYLKPHLGGQFPFTSAAQSSSKPSFFNPFGLNISLGGGLDLQLALNQKWRFSVGGHYGSYGLDFRIKGPVGYGGRGRQGTLIRFPVQVQYDLVDNVHWFRLSKSDLMYLFLFKVYVSGGLSYNHLIDELDRTERNYTNGTINLSLTPPVLERRQNVSAYLAAGVQFFSRSNDRLDIGIFYSKGFLPLISQDLTYEYGGKVYQTRLLSGVPYSDLQWAIRLS